MPTTIARALVAFEHAGRQVRPGDRLHLTADEAAFLAARGLVRAAGVITVRGAA